MEKLVSVIIPTFNEEKYVKSCLSHLAKQTYPNFEVIVSDCDSTDNTAKIAKKFNVKIENTLIRNRSAACNLALLKAKGDYILFTDADVDVPKDWIEKYVKRFSKTDAQVLGAPNVTHFNDGFWAEAIGTIKGISSPVYRNGEVIHVPGCNCAYRKQALEGRKFDKNLLTGEDMDVNLDIVSDGGKIEYADSPAVFHHRRESIRKFARQMYKYGVGYVHLWEKHPELGNKQLYVSALYLGWVISLPMAFIWVKPVFLFYVLLTYAFYFKRNFNWLNLKYVLITPLLGLLQHICMAFGTIHELFMMNVLGRRQTTHRGEK